MENLITLYRPLCKAIATIIPGEVEVVLHDLHSNKIAHIENSMSPRTAGMESLVDLEEIERDSQGGTLIGPYYKTNPDGSKMRSITTVIRTEQGKPVALLCINVCITAFQAAEKALRLLSSIAETPIEPDLIKLDWRETANEIIGRMARENGISIAMAKRQQKIDIMRELDKSGVFDARGSNAYVAQLLGISRANLYELLRLSRK